MFCPDLNRNHHLEESDIKETKSDKKIKTLLSHEESFPNMKKLQKFNYEGPDFPISRAQNHEIHSKILSRNISKTKKVFLKKEIVENWQLLTDNQRNQIKARMFLKRSKIYEDDLIKIGLKVNKELSVNPRIPNDLYSNKDALIMNSKWTKGQNLKIEIFWSLKDYEKMTPKINMEFFNQGYSFETITTNSNMLEYTTKDFSEAVRGYFLGLKIRPLKVAEFTPTFYKRQINVEIPVSKLLESVNIVSQKNFVRHLTRLDLQLETSTYSVDEEFFPTKKEFLHVFKNLTQLDLNKFGGYYRCLGDESLFFLQFEFSEDFLVFKISISYESFTFEGKLRILLQQMIMYISDFYV